MANLKDLPLMDFEHEMANTRRVLERVPEDRFDWRPHERSMSLGELAAHLVDVIGYQVATLSADDLDLSTAPTRTLPPDRSSLLEAFDRTVARVREALASVDEEALTRDWTFRVGEHVIFKRPKLVVFRSFGLSHLAHHRGQLTVYLRLLDVPLPSLYGPTADEN